MNKPTPLQTRVLLQVIEINPLKGVILPDEVKKESKYVKYIIDSCGIKVEQELKQHIGMKAIMKPHTYIVGHPDFKEFILVDQTDIWAVTENKKDEEVKK